MATESLHFLYQGKIFAVLIGVIDTQPIGDRQKEFQQYDQIL